MEDTLITFETAKLAKEKEFTEKCSYYYYYRYVDKNTPDELKLRKFDNCNLLKSNNGIAPPNSEKEYSAPTQSLLQKWLREVHKTVISIIYEENIALSDDYIYKIVIISNIPNNFIKNNKFTTYEEALEKGLLEALKSL